MGQTFTAALVSAGLVLGMGASARAELLTPLVSGPDDGAQVTLVREGCGFGGHRNFYGRCRPNFGPRGRFFGERHYGYGGPYRRDNYFYRHY